ncbi:MAG: hypothetical protein ACFE7R_09885 [Candidatus Hodarchaeota archaeon]
MNEDPHQIPESPIREDRIVSCTCAFGEICCVLLIFLFLISGLGASSEIVQTDPQTALALMVSSGLTALTLAVVYLAIQVRKISKRG